MATNNNPVVVCWKACGIVAVDGSNPVEVSPNGLNSSTGLSLSPTSDINQTDTTVQSQSDHAMLEMCASLPLVSQAGMLSISACVANETCLLV